jgi:tRNA (guanine37-N1)-methyltransferase
MTSVTHRIGFISIFPDLINSYFQYGIMRRSVASKLVDFRSLQLRDFAVDRHGSIDDRPYGGGEGMVMRPEPLAAAIQSLEMERPQIIIPSPRGERWSHRHAENLSKYSELIFVCPRFSGVDQRFIDHFGAWEFSLGDFVISGGELPAIIFADSIIRHIPGALGHIESSAKDSFSDDIGGLLEYPLYTRPEEIWGLKVPEVLMSGDHRAISEWRTKRSQEITSERRPDLLKS